MTDASIASLYANLTFFFITLGYFASVKVGISTCLLKVLAKK